MILSRILAVFMFVLALVPMNEALAKEGLQYKLASGDLIKIQVFNEPELNLETRLSSTGIINYPFLGKILVSGLSVRTLERKLIKGLKSGYLKSPQVNVSIVEHRPLFIEGEVNNPGGYPYIPGLTIRKAVSLAGGFTKFAAKEKFVVVYDKTQHKGIVGANALIGPGDVVVVEKSIFYIYGEVKNAGSYAFRPGLTLREAVSLAGGMTERASEDNTFITSKGGKERAIDKEAMGTKLQPGDAIYIKQGFF